MQGDEESFNNGSKPAGGGLPQDLEQLDNILEQLSIEIQACGFPDCGNLRSTKRKDVRQRVKCLQTMLRQRQKDIDFRSSLQDKFKKNDNDSEMLKEQITRKTQKIQQLDKDRYSLQSQLKEKDEEIRKLKNA